MTRVKLRIGHADGRVEERELEPGSYRVGRENADIVLPHPSVSAHHAQLEVNPERVVIRDVGSRNGSFEPSGKRISADYVLSPEQPVRLGRTTLTLLRALGQAGGTRVMPEVSGPGRTRVMAEVPQPFTAPAEPVPAAPAPAAPRPGRLPSLTSRWIKLLGVAVILLLGFVSFRTCTALVQAVSENPSENQPTPGRSSESPPSKAPTKHPTSKRR